MYQTLYARPPTCWDMPNNSPVQCCINWRPGNENKVKILMKWYIYHYLLIQNQTG